MATAYKGRKMNFEKLEHKLDTGIDRTLSALAGWVQTILRTEQQKTDFNPVSAKLALNTTSSACLRVVKFVNYQVDRIRGSMDGKNLEMVLLELGLRLHRVIYDHLQVCKYTTLFILLKYTRRTGRYLSLLSLNERFIYFRALRTVEQV